MNHNFKEHGDQPRNASNRLSLNGPELSIECFNTIANIASDVAGLSINENKTAMVRTRLARRLRALNIPSFEDYCEYVIADNNKSEIQELISALTTNVSHFFRENHHFDMLRDRVLPEVSMKLGNNEVCRIWSAGCANGQEPYSIAMTLAEFGVKATDSFKILATDIDGAVISFAKQGKYPFHMKSGISEERIKRHFIESSGDIFLRDEVKEFVSFRNLNLLSPWPMKRQFQVIFCRNVVIYFDHDTQSKLWSRFAQSLVPGGWLFLGHSERIDATAEMYFDKCGVTSFKRNMHTYLDSRKE